MNALTITAYSGSTFIANTGLEWAEDVTFTTQYPGGLFGACTFFVPRPVDNGWTLQLAHKIIVRNGMQTVWEGQVTAIDISLTPERQGQTVTALGYWGDALMQRTLRKPWADTGISSQEWAEATTAYSSSDLTLLGHQSVDRLNRIQFNPKPVEFANNEYHRVMYTAPTGQTVKRVTYNYDLQEGSQAWALQLYSNAGSLLSNVTASGTGAVDHTLGTPDQTVFLLLRAQAAQTPPSGTAGTIYGQVSSLVVYTETGSITLTEIAKDVRALATVLSANETLIGTNTLSLVPFISEGDTYAQILMNAASYGDGSYNSWAVGVKESALSTDSKPILFAEQYPALTDYDYAVRLDEPNVVQAFTAERDISAVRNWIGVKYHDEGGRTVYLTPDDDANLKDTTSITAYGERHAWLTIDTSSTTTATNYGRRYLAARKDAQWRVTSDIQVQGYIRTKGGGLVASSEIRAGKRIKVENFLSDLSGTGLTLLVTATQYNDRTQTCRISTGRPDSLDVWLAQMDIQK